jgi:hypothetical protein
VLFAITQDVNAMTGSGSGTPRRVSITRQFWTPREAIRRYEIRAMRRSDGPSRKKSWLGVFEGEAGFEDAADGFFECGGAPHLAASGLQSGERGGLSVGELGGRSSAVPSGRP